MAKQGSDYKGPTYQKPVATKETKGPFKDSTEYAHPAFGVITLTNPQWSGDGGVLFGSDLQHHSTLRVEIQEASLTRGLNRDWIHSTGKRICEIEFSHHQFAEFITSQGRGGGTPCTIRYGVRAGDRIEEKPWIVPLESKAKILKREVRDAAAEGVRDMREEVDKLKAMVETGKVKIGDLREIVGMLDSRVRNLPSNMEYTLKSAEETLATATTAAKMELEAYIDGRARAIGLETIAQLGQLPAPIKDDSAE
jgi:hypothetical protein